MPAHRKPPVFESGRSEGAPPPADSLDFDIESTTMRLKSIRLRRREAELMEQHRLQTGLDPDAPVQAPPSKRVAAPPPPASRQLDDTGSGERPSGRVRHDERGMAVWDWAVATGEFHTLSATSALKKLEVGELKIEETAKVPGLSLEKSGRDKGGGFDPYNQRGSGKRQGEAAERQGVTGATDRAAVLEQLLGKK
ncbi:MAG TPA: hypothetical protein VMF52_18525 [Steroidobacteraceae bacterium]|nr:hypothetical protein [Steroidobacteraceae bacterium]